MIKALVFDCYGTIISTGNGSVEASKIILNNVKSQIDPKIFYKTWKKIHKENIQKLKHFCTEEKIFNNDLKMLFQEYGIKNSPRKNIKPMLNSLYNRKYFDDVIINLVQLKNKYSIFIASNSDTKPLMENVGNEKYLFNGIYTSEILRAYKPSNIFFEKLLIKINYNKDEVLFIGDSIEDDIIGANTVGLKSVLVNRKNKVIDENCPANYIINNIYELNNILNSIRPHCI